MAKVLMIKVVIWHAQDGKQRVRDMDEAHGIVLEVNSEGRMLQVEKND